MPDAEGSKLYAVGSAADVEMFNNSVITLQDSAPGGTDSWEDYCNNSEVTNATTCAGSIVDNGGRVIYPWN